MICELILCLSNDRRQCHALEWSLLFLLRLFVFLVLDEYTLPRQSKLSASYSLVSYGMVCSVFVLAKAVSGLWSVLPWRTTPLAQSLKSQEDQKEYSTFPYTINEVSGAVCCPSGCLYRTFFATDKQLGANIRQPGHI